MKGEQKRPEKWRNGLQRDISFVINEKPLNEIKREGEKKGQTTKIDGC